MSAGAKRARARPAPIRPPSKFSRCETTGKRGYRAKGIALEVASRASRTGKQRAYRCPDCGNYHLTRSRA